MVDPLSIKKSYNPLYLTWVNMRRRCTEKETKDSYRYIDRGISFSEDWLSFDSFYRDMASTYKKGLSLDRIENDKGYSLENCRWATPKEQANNTGRNRRITIDGVTKTLSQWIDSVDIKSSTVRQRFYGMGWTIEKSLYTPLAKLHKQ